MFDTEYNDQVRSFVESAEPDVSYNGSDGILAVVIESAENMATINYFIEEADEKEKKGVLGTVGGWVSTAFKKLKELILKLISKIKGLFVSLFHKLKTLYAQAIKKIGEFVKKGVNFSDKNRATCEWYVLTKALPIFKAKFTTGIIVDFAKGNKNFSYVSDLTTGKFISLATNSGVAEKIDSKGYSAYVKENYFEKKTGNISDKDFEKIYKTNVSELNKAYKDALSSEAEMIKAIDAAEKEMKDEGESKADRMKAINKVVHTHNAALTSWMSAVFSASIFGFHQALKATLVGLKGTIGAKLRSGKDKAGTGMHKFARKYLDDNENPTTESFEIEDDDRFAIV